jgi:sorbitol-specific phosphotransferase system component IIC
MANINNFPQLVGLILGYIGRLIPLLLALTVLVFLWGVFKLVWHASEKSVEDGTRYVTIGIVGLFVMVSVWGLVRFLSVTFFDGNVVIPQFRTSLLIEHLDSKEV